jgi:uncharacterized protein (DUF1684 family)
MKTPARLITATLVASLLASCGSSSGAGNLDDEAIEAGVIEWRKGRLERLMAPNGYLTLVGLFWLDEDISTFGGARQNDLLFPGAADARMGEFRVTTDGVLMAAAEGVEMRSGGEPVASILISDDTTEDPVMINYGSMAWTVIQRDGRFAVRLRDYENRAVDSFPPLEYFPIDPGWHVEATFTRYAEPRSVAANTVIEGLGWNPVSPGLLEFHKDGQAYEIEPYLSGERLFLVFGDTTNGRETYPAGRFLYADMPGEDGKTVLDFNRAYSPPCAFNDFSTCPIASPRNRLPTAVNAGELYNEAAYLGSH